MNTRPLIILTILVAAIVGAAMWFLNSQPPTVLPPALTTPVTPSTPLAVEPPAPSRSMPAPQRTAALPKPEVEKEPEAVAEWELKIDEVLRTDAGETNTAQMLINLLPTLPPEGQAEAAQHITNLILDDEYNRVLPLIRNTSLPEEVQDVLLTDLMNREDVVKLPTLLEIAKLPTHPLQEEAKTDLEIFLDEEFGNDWPKWDAAVKKHLAAEKAEAAAEAAANPPVPPITQ